ncbi:MAG: hypothetical protein Q7S22_06075 [Candidatus Micrarchaeota archaeon]|nr:hypothetical protein [Candidatus Micrarchaeota archaeon]
MIKNLSIFIVLFLLFGCTSQPDVVINSTIILNETTTTIVQENATTISNTTVTANTTSQPDKNATEIPIINVSDSNITNSSIKIFTSLSGYENCGSIRQVTYVPTNPISVAANQCFSRNLKNCSHAQVFDETGTQTEVYTIVGKVLDLCLIHLKVTDVLTDKESAQICKMDSTVWFYLPNELEGKRSIWLLKNATFTDNYLSSKTNKVYSLPCSDYAKSYIPVIYMNIENGLPLFDYGTDFYSDKTGSLGWIHSTSVRDKNLKDMLSSGYGGSDKKGKDALSLVSIYTGTVSPDGIISEEYEKIHFQYVFNNDKTKCVWFDMTLLAASEVGAKGNIVNCNRDSSPINDSEIITDWNYDSDDLIPYAPGLSSYKITSVYMQMRDLKNYQGPLYFDSIALQKINEFSDNVPIMVVEFEPTSGSKGPGYLLFNAKTGKLVKNGGYNAENFQTQVENYIVPD